MSQPRRVSMVFVGGTRRAYNTLRAFLERDDIDVVHAIVQRDYDWDEQWHPRIVELCNQYRVPYEESDSGKALPQQSYEHVRSLSADVIIGGGIWRALLRSSFWETARYGYIALHNSKLPEYRGFANVNWYIINGESELTLRMFQLGTGIDDGPLVCRSNGTPIEVSIALDRDRQLGDILDEIEQRNIELLLELIEAIKIDDVRFQSQDESQATYCCHRGPEDAEIDWSQSAIRIHNLIRSQSEPYAGAYSYYNNQRFHIFQSSIRPNQHKYVGVIPGKIVSRRPDEVDVLTGAGVITIERIKVDGQLVQPGEFLRSIRVRLGFNVQHVLDDLSKRVLELEQLLAQHNQVQGQASKA